MNKYLKYGLLLQIPNAIIISVLILGFAIMNVPWNAVFDNFIPIILGTLWALTNIGSVILLFMGLFEDADKKKSEKNKDFQYY